jgi:TonB-dependent SusC/RagA subfamily outer membrane receptor
MKTKEYLLLVYLVCTSLVSTGQNADKQSARKITLTGFVLSSGKRPVEGAIFYIDDVKTSFKSKKDGSYKIKVDPASHKILAKSSQYGSCEKEIDSQTSIEFTLNGIAENSSLRAAESGSRSVSSDSTKTNRKNKPKKLNTYNDIYQMIRVEVPGVVVSGKSILIQQGHSFFGSSEPLFVVNGSIVNNIDYINPVEVKSITVLKGSQAAIYGVQGSNGVISIKLKNGTEKDK